MAPSASLQRQMDGDRWEMQQLAQSGFGFLSSSRVKDDEDIYDFWKVTYHDIDFDELHEVE